MSYNPWCTRRLAPSPVLGGKLKASPQRQGGKVGDEETKNPSDTLSSIHSLVSPGIESLTMDPTLHASDDVGAGGVFDEDLFSRAMHMNPRRLDDSFNDSFGESHLAVEEPSPTLAPMAPIHRYMADDAPTVMGAPPSSMALQHGMRADDRGSGGPFQYTGGMKAVGLFSGLGDIPSFTPKSMEQTHPHNAFGPAESPLYDQPSNLRHRYRIDSAAAGSLSAATYSQAVPSLLYETFTVLRVAQPLSIRLASILMEEGCPGCQSSRRDVPVYELVCRKSSCSHVVHASCMDHVSWLTHPHDPLVPLNMVTSTPIPTTRLGVRGRVHIYIEFNHVASNQNIHTFRGSVEPDCVSDASFSPDQMATMRLYPGANDGYIPAVRARVSCIVVTSSLHGGGRFEHDFPGFDGSNLFHSRYMEGASPALLEVSFTAMSDLHKLALQFDTRINNDSSLCLKLVSVHYFMPMEHLGIARLVKNSGGVKSSSSYDSHAPPSFHHPDNSLRMDPSSSSYPCSVEAPYTGSSSQAKGISVDNSMENPSPLRVPLSAWLVPLPTSPKSKSPQNISDVSASISLDTSTHSTTSNKMYSPSLDVSKLLPKLEGQSLKQYICTFNGSRVVQQALDDDPNTAMAFAKELMKDGKSLDAVVCDQYGNYAVQRLFKVANARTKESIIRHLYKSIPALASSLQGSLSIQSMIASTSASREIGDIFIRAIQNNVVDLIQDKQGTYVIQKCLENFPFKSTAPIIRKMIKELVASGSKVAYDYTDLWAMSMRLAIDVSCSGIRQALSQCVISLATKLAKSEFGHLVVMHILLPLISSTSLQNAANTICATHAIGDDDCDRCACLEVASSLGTNASIPDFRPSRICCCEFIASTAQRIVSIAPANDLFNAIESEIDVLCLNRWGKKVMERFFDLDAKMDIMPLINRICNRLSSDRVIRRILNERRGVNFIVTVMDRLPWDGLNTLRQSIANIITESGALSSLDSCCMGIESDALFTLVTGALSSRERNFLPKQVMLLYLASPHHSKDIAREIATFLRTQDWYPASIAAGPCESWKAIVNCKRSEIWST